MSNESSRSKIAPGSQIVLSKIGVGQRGDAHLFALVGCVNEQVSRISFS